MTTIVAVNCLDIDALHDLRTQSLQEGFRSVERLCDEWATGSNRFNAPGEALYLAVAGERVVGVCGLNRDPYAGQVRVGRVRRLYVLPSYRRRGIGHALLNAVIDQARTAFDRLRVRTAAADSFYSAHGFQPGGLDSQATHVLDLGPAAPLEHRFSRNLDCRSVH